MIDIINKIKCNLDDAYFLSVLLSNKLGTQLNFGVYVDGRDVAIFMRKNMSLIEIFVGNKKYSVFGNIGERKYHLDDVDLKDAPDRLVQFLKDFHELEIIPDHF